MATEQVGVQLSQFDGTPSKYICVFQFDAGVLGNLTSHARGL